MPASEAGNLLTSRLTLGNKYASIQKSIFQSKNPFQILNRVPLGIDPNQKFCENPSQAAFFSRNQKCTSVQPLIDQVCFNLPVIKSIVKSVLSLTTSLEPKVFDKESKTRWDLPAGFGTKSQSCTRWDGECGFVYWDCGNPTQKPQKQSTAGDYFDFLRWNPWSNRMGFNKEAYRKPVERIESENQMWLSVEIGKNKRHQTKMQ